LASGEANRRLHGGPLCHIVNNLKFR